MKDPGLVIFQATVRKNVPENLAGLLRKCEAEVANLQDGWNWA